MASINKSFNFRHGVQVDDDDFTVRGGLVGIGTTVPTERLDVRGNAVVSGLTSSISLQVTGITTLTTVDIGITSIKSGIITASSGIVTYYGDGQYLKFLPTSQWVDIDVGLGFTSIYNTGGNVGVSTDDPRNSFQVGGDPTNSSTGVGINSDGGHIFASGIVTATSFVGEVNAPNFDTNAAGVVVSGVVTATSLQGALTGNVTGNVTGDLTGEVNSSKFDTNPSGIVVTGVATATSFVGDITGDVTGNTQGIHTGAVNFNDNVKATFGSANEVQMFHKPDSSDFRAEFDDTNFIILSRTLDVKNQAGNKASITVFEPGGIPEVRLFNDGNEKLRTTGYGVTIFNQLNTPNLNVTGISTTFDLNVDGHTDLDNVSISGVTTFTGATTHSGGATVNTHLDVIGLTTLDDVNVSSGATFGGAVNVTGNLQSANLGLGIAPNTDLQIFNSTGESQILLGNSSAITGTNAAIRYNSDNASFPFSSGTPQSLDIINYGKGSINFYLEAGTVGLGTGDINFIRRSNFDELMTLTYGGRLGIGITVPTNNLHVVGTSTVTGNSFAGGNISAGNNLIAAGSITGASLSVPRVDSTLFGNVNSTSGISTFQSLKTTGTTQGTSAQFATGVGIGVTASGVSLSINSATSNRFTFTQGGGLRIKGTTINNGIDLETNINDGRVLFGAVGVGTTQPKAAIDFSDAGKNTTIPAYQNRMYMLPPKLNTTQRIGLSTETGAVIYNTSTNKLQVYTGSAWANCN